MSFLRNLKLQAKLGLMLAIFASLAIVSVVFSTAKMRTIEAGYSSASEHQAEAALHLASAGRALVAAGRSIAGLAIAPDDDRRNDARGEITESRKDFVDQINAAKNAYPKNADAYEAIASQASSLFSKACAESIKLGEAAAAKADLAAAQASYMSSCEPAFDPVIDAIDAMTQAADGEKIKINENLTELADSAIVTTYWMILGGLAIFSITAFLVVRSLVTKPLVRITGTIERLANGDLTVSPQGTGRLDEIGLIARAVQVFKDNALRTRELETEAAATRQSSEQELLRNSTEAKRIAEEEIQRASSGLALGLKRLAAGDLSFELTEPFAPDFEALRHDINAAVAQLSETLRSVAQSTNAIDTGTREISQSSDDLSKRTEQQAASLEETAAALDQITVNVSNSSKRADEARAVAVQANTSAAQSGKVVANAVDAIQRIEESSKRISSIIGVIDEIAFQTNLLALNAGVEAARAGEAGRGFAVVAQEVRELAQRSAKAAKEIKDLISTSTNEVEGGVKLVRETGESLRTIEQYVVTINHHMDAIAISAREQSTGLAEVNTAVNQMDQVTQQNAAMVEETNAASASLANEAGRLHELISRFNFGGDGNRAPGVATRRQSVPTKGSPIQAQGDHRPVASPARRMVADVARAYGGAAVAAKESWEEF